MLDFLSGKCRHKNMKLDLTSTVSINMYTHILTFRGYIKFTVDPQLKLVNIFICDR